MYVCIYYKNNNNNNDNNNDNNTDIIYIYIYIMYLLITGTAPPRVPKLVSARLLHIAAVSEKIRRSTGCSGSFGNVAS